VFGATVDAHAASQPVFVFGVPVDFVLFALTPVRAVLLLTAPLRRPAIMPETLKGTVFLLALVTSASLMPLEELPAAS
jgi:hypothetical protein